MSDSTTAAEQPDATASDAAPFSAVLVGDVASEPAEFWSAAAEHRLVVQRCQDCGTRLRPGRWACTACRSIDLGWADVGGRGSVYSVTAVHQLYHPEYADRRPYYVGLVDLDQGPRLATRLLAPATGKLEIGDRVCVTFVDVGGRVVPAFELDDEFPGGASP